jgi:hypothetical protein
MNNGINTSKYSTVYSIIFWYVKIFVYMNRCVFTFQYIFVFKYVHCTAPRNVNERKNFVKYNILMKIFRTMVQFVEMFTFFANSDLID